MGTTSHSCSEVRRFDILPEVVIIEPDLFEDQGGLFMEMHHQARFHAAGMISF
jgi:dTDP-4-dehydrorhamnose 3,5-epimerase-like enzyme